MINYSLHNNRILFDRARSALATYFLHEQTPFSPKEECLAAVTHWLQNRSVLPPFFSCQNKNIAEALLIGLTNFNDQEKICDHSPFQLTFEIVFDDIPYPPPSNPSFTFIDLFAGIGGIRLAFQDAGGKCVFSSEWDKYAKQTYERNFGEVPYGDIRQIDADSIPDHDVLCAGFPCQPFSLAGVSKKNSLGRKHGFEDPTQGTLFFDIKRILLAKRPKAFFLENVKNLLHHDRGRTWAIIQQTLEDELQYVINWCVVDAAKWVPQHRERIFIVGYDPKKVSVTKEDINIPKEPRNPYIYPELGLIIQQDVESIHTLGPGTWATLERHKAHHAAVGNGFGYGLHKRPFVKGSTTRTISARYHKDGAEILIDQPEKGRPRKLTVEEAMQLQGFDPKKFVFPVSLTQAYKQIGNSVAIPAVSSCASTMISFLLGNKCNHGSKK